MPPPLTDQDREQILAEVTEAYNAISKLVSDLRRRYSAKSTVLKAAVKAECDLFQLKREILKLDLENTHARSPLPSLTRGKKSHRSREALTSPRRVLCSPPFQGRFFARTTSGLGLLPYAQDMDPVTIRIVCGIVAVILLGLIIWRRRLGTSLNNLAGLYRAQGKHAEAEPLYQRALAINEKALGPDHPDTAATLGNYAILLRALSRGEEAARLEARAQGPGR